jgi:predicted SnoaL-like aldol condensation-catalyzing enzyme
MTTTSAAATPSDLAAPDTIPGPRLAAAAANRALIMRFIDEYQTGGDEAVLHATVSSQLVNRTPMTPDAPGGPAEVKAIFDGLHAGLEGFSVQVLHQLADDRIVMTHKVFSGRHTGELFGIAATGRDVRFAVMDVVRIADGQIVEHWGIVDIPALQSQLMTTS